MFRLSSLGLCVIALFGCAKDSIEVGAVSGMLRHSFPAIEVQPGEDRQGLCQSWTLDNEAPLYVSAVRMTTQGGWHHSNWYFTTDDHYDGPDGTWPCRDRSFEALEAASRPGSGVFFAQSTQAEDETQAFPQGAVIVLPAHARIVGDVHLINVTSSSLSTHLSFEVATLEASAVRTRLTPMSFTFDQGLVVPARSNSVVRMECDLGRSTFALTGAPASFHIYYVLPHYHQRGVGMRLEAVGGALDGQVIYETDQGVGDPLGAMLRPTFDATGIEKVRMSCFYENTDDHDVHYANSLDGEMCMFLAYTDAPFIYTGISLSSTVSAEQDEDGRKQVVGACQVVPFNFTQPDAED